MRATIRPAGRDDAAAIAAIHNQGIEERSGTFETEPRTAADIVAYIDRDAPPFIVAELAGRVVGWARLSPYSSRECYSGVGEAALYVDRDHRAHGVGRALMEALAAAAERRGYWKITGLLFPTNAASAALCRSAEFREVGTFRRHGQLDGQWRDVLLVERLLAGGDAR